MRSLRAPHVGHWAEFGNLSGGSAHRFPSTACMGGEGVGVGRVQWGSWGAAWSQLPVMSPVVQRRGDRRRVLSRITRFYLKIRASASYSGRACPSMLTVGPANVRTSPSMRSPGALECLCAPAPRLAHAGAPPAHHSSSPSLALPPPSFTPTPRSFRRPQVPFLKRRCLPCHRS